MLMRPQRPPDETPTLPPISVLITPYTFTPPPLPSLPLRMPSRHCLPSLRLRSSPRHAANTSYHPYTRGVPSQHAPDTTYPYACVVPSEHAPDTAYHPYTCGVPS
ncbi:hypothetical protein O181_060368 [Austropuccinia psidii MF-1]|uniref:Uncharacterized protein n=1 Tax=Austropuccinia psidii MF-1 TaxID=1389203 RepID=A0A9Q3EGD9_9BASI|nr:hypothetical protein [Austropuccinia psidii MF-1]